MLVPQSFLTEELDYRGDTVLVKSSSILTTVLSKETPTSRVP